ncbi:MAG: 2,3-bisphosphoglycerate-independent phosphoglycerate mutase [Bacteroidia bacterium]|nr:2,3-bisphosphoglycerate-independent phosphoglycerate mutase [Bacteroidia bacterium]
MTNYNKVILLILDGWGIGKHDKSDAIYNANTPFIDKLYSTVPNSNLLTHGLNVGLPEGQMGNSEVGHINIGAGRIVYQMLTRIDKEFAEGQVSKSKILLDLIKLAKSEKKKIHLIGLVSDGGVHSSLEHLIALCGIIKKNGLQNQTFIHAFTDGRDTDPNGGIGYIEKLCSNSNSKDIKIASCIGRYYAMDRDKRWERVKNAYDLLTKGNGEKYIDINTAIKNSYKSGVSDEFIKPISICDNSGKQIATIEEGDIVINFNFRTDRGREITTVLTQRDFPEYEMKKININYLTFTEYDKEFKDVKILFDNKDITNTLGECLSKNNISQVRAAETEKYPHVTFFFSGGRETAYINEKRILIPSPKVATYDQKPEMSAVELKNAVIEEINKNEFGFFCINFANPDMVGHTGVYYAIIKAVETVDSCISEIVEAGIKNGYKFIIIADHGNADNAINEDGTPNTAHSTNPVPCFIIGEDNIKMKDGILADVAPTILKMMGIEQPKEMTGNALY